LIHRRDSKPVKKGSESFFLIDVFCSFIIWSYTAQPRLVVVEYPHKIILIRNNRRAALNKGGNKGEGEK